ncbi:hypothetical protein [Klebsiella phage phiKp_21]|uniref:virion structural protein n=1 Tax=Klebsiella phage K64-1 TaxID=1439894 RepID=UPI0018A3E934|nr:virion structural protein [Klebsiella phage K64-1]QOE32544.1 hypothetical protein CPT_Muenster_372 [Klebsiella phage Muenster]UYL05020.1 hypothetical protein DIDNDMLP_00029 [Klebsiella phage KP13-7]BEH88143.1 hypothetical protein [Klebsiella phage phiKp_21]
MRSIKTDNGYSIILSNEEYSLYRKIKARKKIHEESLPEYYQELANKLVSRGVLDKTEDNIYTVK